MKNDEHFTSQENPESNNDSLLIRETESNNTSSEEAKWYVIHTYSGYEKKVKEDIKKIIENRNMKDLITEVVVPIQKTEGITKNGKKKPIEKKIFPGYVFLKMIMNDETWYVVRNTRGVTSFVGPGSKPVALTEQEIINMGAEIYLEINNIKEDDIVIIKDESFYNASGVVKEVNTKKGTVTVIIDLFGGRKTPTEISLNKVQKK